MSAAGARPGMKRFWDQAKVGEAAGGFAILLDGKKLLIPGRPRGGARDDGALLVPGRALAEAVAAEWQAAGGANGGALSMEAVPLTRLAGTAQERIAPAPGPVALELAKYAETDLLCYRAERPETLVVRQAKAWQPWLDWLERMHGARLEPVEGVMFRAQDGASLARVRAAMAGYGAWMLAGLGVAVPALGSAVLGMALAEGALEAGAAVAAATVDEMFEVEQWGEDAEARRRREDAAADVAVAGRFMRLVAAG